MIKSMTGFGREERILNFLDITVELRSVNHRFFEFNCRTPRGYTFLEEKLKSYVSTRVGRGKVDAFITIESSGDVPVEIDINRAYTDGYVSALKHLSKIYGVKYDVTVSSLARNPEVFAIKKSTIDEDQIWDSVRAVAETAVDRFIAMRELEGQKLKEDVLYRAKVILDSVSFIESRSPETVKAYRSRLEEKIRELISDATIDEQRLITETAIFADKIAVDEETVRLRSHIDQLSTLLESDESVGRKLDFIVQEMNREANTIGSKSQSVEIAHAVVEIKAQIEKIREQIQNIE